MTTTDRSPLNIEKTIREREEAVDLLLNLAWHSVDFDSECEHWRRAKRFLERIGAWRKPT